MLSELEISSVMEYFDVRPHIFSQYIKFFYDKKAEPGIPAARKTLYKSLLNQLYGKMGQRKFGERRIIRMSDVDNDPSIIN
jgi:hypothetical protein